MLGRIAWTRQRVSLCPGRLWYGLPVVELHLDPEALLFPWTSGRCYRKAGELGVTRALAPRGFDHWDRLAAVGIRSVSPLPLLRGLGGPLAVAALHRNGTSPSAACVALRGRRADRDMQEAAHYLVPRVRHLVIAAPEGGRELGEYINRHFGVPVLPPSETGDVGLCFSRKTGEEREQICLSHEGWELGTAVVSAPELREEDRTDLSVIEVLWERGKLAKTQINIT